ncbi:hypothetical protein AMTRI_Chr02g214110 [Amborella trichopoda]|uniref:Plus3 domain-containing protein n=1 Tax=Amborella trichopoda TaxID=13333 RepID=U5CY12_AMBTC|nr:protein RTF1 homolog [Amborella trichopoda]ERN15034.1 hypothetical protein AMTR_s00032p00242160 [Amborella trichopoda]|eukprot:XP_006853567.1 protein RTF1 homolog [Amborella trichopoda]
MSADDLEHLLLEAAGRTSTSGRKKPSQTQPKRRHEGSYSDDGSDPKYESEDDDDSDGPGYPSRKPSGSQVPLKKRFETADKDDMRGKGDRDGGSDDSDSGLSVGSDLYKDENDREELSRMTELEREMILTDRADRRDNLMRMKKAERQGDKSRSTGKELMAPPQARGRSSAKSDRMANKDALTELLAKMQRKSRNRSERQDLMVVRNKAAAAASPVSDSPPSSGVRSSSDGREVSVELGESDEDEGPTSGSEHPTFEDIKGITIRRSRLAKWFLEPFFEEAIVGCFVRVGIGTSRSGQSIYRLCMVRNVDASDPDRQYKFENRTTHKYLNCVWGSEASAARWQMARISDSAPLEKEFLEWVREVERGGGRMPTKQDVIDKGEAIQRLSSSFVYSAATVKQMLQEKKSASTRPSNIAAEKDRLRKEMELAESRLDHAEAERVRARLQELENLSQQSKKKDAKAVMLAEMNRRNRAENFKNASELKPVNTSLKAGEAGYDPFSRRWTRSRNYYVSKPEGGGEVVKEEAETAATKAALEAAADAGKLVDTKAPVDEGTESHSLHDFELPISLAGLQRFGGPQGAQLAFMARKQRIEATIGVRVPENDGRRHSLTLSVSDYKRRRGLV